MDRFSNQPFRSSYDPDSKNPYHAEINNPCEICNEEPAKYESDKVKFKWGEQCNKDVKDDFKLTDSDVDYI